MSLKGIDEITKKINKAVAQLKRTSSKGLVKAAVHVVSKASIRAPIESSDLRNSVYIDLDGKRVASGQDGVAGISADVGGNAKIAEIAYTKLLILFFCTVYNGLCYTRSKKCYRRSI